MSCRSKWPLGEQPLHLVIRSSCKNILAKRKLAICVLITCASSFPSLSLILPLASRLGYFFCLSAQTPNNFRKAGFQFFLANVFTLGEKKLVKT